MDGTNKGMTAAYLLSCLGQELSFGLTSVSSWLRGILRSYADSSITMEYSVREEMCNPAGYLQGGVQVAMIDEAISMLTAAECDDRFNFTLNLYVDFLNVVRQGARVTVLAKLVRTGQTIVNAECTITDERKQLVARCTANMRRSDRKPLRSTSTLSTGVSV